LSNVSTAFPREVTELSVRRLLTLRQRRAKFADSDEDLHQSRRRKRLSPLLQDHGCCAGR
jgi:hypothetical protein